MPNSAQQAPAPALALDQMTTAQLNDEYVRRGGQIHGTRPFRTKGAALNAVRTLILEASRRPPPPPPPPTAVPVNPDEAQQSKRSKMQDMTIRIVTEGNPRRPGSASHRHFELMRSSPTVRDYLSYFDTKDEKRVARQWLYNTVQDGHVEIVKGDTNV